MADTRPQPSAEPVADWLQECTDGRVSSHTITMLNAFRRWYDEYRVNPALEAARREDQARIADLEACIDLVIPDDCKSQLHEDATNMLKLQARIEALEADNARLREALGEICTDSNPDWTEKRLYPNDVLDDIHTIAVNAYYKVITV